MKKLIILNFETQEIHVYQYDENIWNSPEEFTDQHDEFVINDNCQYMVVKELKIQIH